MIILKNILIFSILLLFFKVNGQTIDKDYQGWWAKTSWTFEFNKDGTYKRVSKGHYGNTIVTGKYKIKNDTIQLLTGYNNTGGTLNEKYLINNDSLIIDLELYYDYKLTTSTGTNFYNSKKRYDILKTPDPDLLNIITRQRFDSIIKASTSIVENYEIIDIKDSDHIKIIRLINTINMSQNNSFKSGIYFDFMKLVKEKDYEKKMSIYFDWIPNRGMGFYFQKLQIELGGTPHLYSRYKIE